MKSVLDESDVDIEDVSPSKDFRIGWNPMTHDVVYRRASGLGKRWLGLGVSVIEGCGRAIEFFRHEYVALLIEFVSRDTRMYMLTDHLEDRRCELADIAHIRYVLLIKYRRFFQDFSNRICQMGIASSRVQFAPLSNRVNLIKLLRPAATSYEAWILSDILASPI